jgi:integrase
LPKITKRGVDAMRPDPSGADVFLWDSELRGFGIRMKPTGAASYLVQYRNAEGRTRRLVIGKVGTLTADEGRAIGREKLAEVAKGQDPSEARHATRASVTVAEFCSMYQAACKSGEVGGRGGRPMKASTIEGDRLRIDVHVNPLIGQRALSAITSDDIRKLKTDIAAGKTAQARSASGRGGLRTGGRGTASRVLGMMAPLLEYAKTLKLIKENPARGVPKYSDQKRDRFLSPDEIERIGAAMGRLEADGSFLTGIAAIRLLMLTGFRRTEALGLPWAWVDAKAKCIRFGDTKTGAQLRPIGQPAIDLLAGMPKRNERWVFPAERGPNHFVGLPKVLAKVCAVAGIEGVTAHVMRHTFASVAAELNFSELTIAGLLGHSVPGVTARYAHVPDSALVAAADRVSRHIAGLMSDEKNKVIEFSGRFTG